MTSHHLRKKILEDVWEGLELKRVAEKGFSFRVVLVGLHEFESRSKAAAATGGGLVFCGGLEDANSKDLAAKLAELAGAACYYVRVRRLESQTRKTGGLAVNATLCPVSKKHVYAGRLLLILGVLYLHPPPPAPPRRPYARLYLHQSKHRGNR